MAHAPACENAPNGQTSVISRVQYRQALPSRNAGLKEDSRQKNRKIRACGAHARGRRKHVFLAANGSQQWRIFEKKPTQIRDVCWEITKPIFEEH